MRTNVLLVGESWGRSTTRWKGFVPTSGRNWLSPAFCAWEGYGRLWRNLPGWLAQGR